MERELERERQRGSERESRGRRRRQEDIMVEWPNIPPRDESHVDDVCSQRESERVVEVGNVDLQNEIYSALI